MNEAVKIFFKEEATQELLDAWCVAHQSMAATLIKMENKYRPAQKKAVGSWVGFRTFKLSKIQEEVGDDFSDMSGDEDDDEDDDEDNDYKSKVYYFVPEDSKALPDFERNQYVCLKLDLAGTYRNYMLTKECGPGQGSLSIALHNTDPSLVSRHLFNEL